MKGIVQPQELRVGNIFKVLGKERELIGITKRNGKTETSLHYAEFSGIIPIKLMHLKPIPLTDEWLIKFDFAKGKGWDDMEFWEMGHFSIYSNLIGYEYDDFKILHVHQLQNIYHSLTGVELKINTK